MRIAVVGASHQGAVVVDLMHQLGRQDEILFVVDSSDTGSFVGSLLGRYEVSHDLSSLEMLAGDLDGVVPAVGSAKAREEVAAMASELDLELVSLVHPSASLATEVHVRPGAVICATAVVGVGASIGTAAIVNSGAVVEHDCIVGDFSHIAPGALLAGGVNTGSGSWVGIGAVVLEDLTIGDKAIVGAGAVVTSNVEPRVTVTGVPARPQSTPRDHG